MKMLALRESLSAEQAGGWGLTPLQIEAELDSSGNVVSRFVYGNGINVPELVVRPAENKVYQVVTDHLGSPVLVVNVTDPEDVMMAAHYDAWGVATLDETAAPDGSWPIPHGFAGGLYDEDTGFVRFGARDYDPRVGRWTGKDPILFNGGQENLYVYVGNDPVNAQDPLGLFDFGRVNDRASQNFTRSNDLLFGGVQRFATNAVLGAMGNQVAKKLGFVTAGELAKTLFRQLRPGALRGLPLGIPALGLGGSAISAAIARLAITGGAVFLAFEAGLYAGSYLGAGIEELLEDEDFSDYACTE